MRNNLAAQTTLMMPRPFTQLPRNYCHLSLLLLQLVSFGLERNAVERFWRRLVKRCWTSQRERYNLDCCRANFRRGTQSVRQLMDIENATTSSTNRDTNNAKIWCRCHTSSTFPQSALPRVGPWPPRLCMKPCGSYSILRPLLPLILRCKETRAICGRTLGQHKHNACLCRFAACYG